MARVVALIPDLLFGSRVQADLLAANHQIELVASTAQARERMQGADVLVVDLTDECLEGARLVSEPVSSNAEPADGGPRTLGFYSHVDTHTRQSAERAGFDMVVPRSRMAREGATLIDRLAG